MGYFDGAGMDVGGNDPLAEALGGIDNSYGYDPWSIDEVNNLNTSFGGVGDYTGTGNWWDGLSGLGNMLSFGGGSSGGGGYRLPIPQLASSLLGMMGQSDVKSTLMDMFNQTKNADPWNSQMGQYQPLLYSIASGNIGETPYGKSIMNSTAKKMASMGYMGSGNMAPAIARSLNNATPGLMQAYTPLAMGRAPNMNSAGALGLGIGQAEAGRYNALGYGLGNLFNGASAPAPQVRSGGGGSNPLGDIAGIAGAIAGFL